MDTARGYHSVALLDARKQLLVLLRALLLRTDDHEVKHSDDATEHEDVHDERVDGASAIGWSLDECKCKHGSSGMLKKNVTDVVR
jgi:hypothetical protein